MSRRYAGPLMVLVLVGLPRAAAAGAVYEGFDYPVRAPLGTWAGGSGAWDQHWYFPDGNGDMSITAGSLSDPTGTLLTTGNHLAGNYTFEAARWLTNRPGAGPGGEFWVSFLMRREPLAEGRSGLYLATDSGAVYIGDPGGTNQIVIGDIDAEVPTGVAFEGGRDYFLVARFQMGPGKDPATLWVNPTPGVMPTSGGTAYPGSDLNAEPTYVSFMNAAPASSIARFDELRMGTSYAEVAPAVPEPAAALPAAALLLLTRRRRCRPPQTAAI